MLCLPQWWFRPRRHQQRSTPPETPTATPYLLHLPNELLLEISKHLNVKDISSLTLTNHSLSTLLTPSLHQFALSEKHCVTALYLSTANGHEAMMRLLLSQGAPITIIGYRIGTFTISATSRLPVDELNDLLSFLLTQGAASIILSSTCRESALHRAAGDGNEKLAKILLAKGVSTTHRDMYGWTPLHWAVHGGNITLLRLLLAHAGHSLLSGSSEMSRLRHEASGRGWRGS